ncbi:MAG: N-acetylneuraminate synthase [Bacteroidales bacterium]|nr:N-acetylneuraminate synthase [Bacteroidales bacterium]MCM1414545.1 N-acetylneuraminate synthase [bacterium]MCM1422595.1 N-acetylneuraminate synthase [bacterium]
MSKIFVIAEAGVNHNGSLETAKKMIDAAAEAGADAVKFQTFQADHLVRKDARKADYQLENAADKQESQYEMLRKLELTESMHRELAEFCADRGIQFLSTPFDIDSIHFLENLVALWKVPSGEITNYPYLREIGRSGKPVILSTGMCEMQEVKDAVRVLQENGSREITLLHCNTEYPTPMSDVNLRAMCTLREELGLPVGYSDHTQGIEVPIAAAAMGAVVIEKHFTLDRNMEGPDHKASLEPEELRAMVQAIRNIETAMGDGIKRPSASEIKNRDVARKSIVAQRAIHKGEMFTEENLTTKRPGSGISPMRWNEVIGTAADRDYEEDELIRGYL